MCLFRADDGKHDFQITGGERDAANSLHYFGGNLKYVAVPCGPVHRISVPHEGPQYPSRRQPRPYCSNISATSLCEVAIICAAITGGKAGRLVAWIWLFLR